MKVKLMKLPLAYQEVEYIAGSGTQFIDTGVKLSSEDTIKCKFEVTATPGSNSEGIFGTMEQINSTNTFFVLLMRSPNLARVGTSANQVNSTNVALNTIYNVELSNGKYVENGTTYSFTAHSGFNFTTNCYVLARNQTNQTPISAKIYSFEITNKFYGIPCYRKSDNAIGLYDAVSKTFFTNAGSGTFTKGNDVSSFMTARVSTVKRTQNLLRLSRTEWNTDSKNPTDSVVFDYNKLYYMASSGYIRPNPGTLNETITRTFVEYTQTSSSWWGIGYPIEIKPNTKYTISAKRLEGTNTKINHTLYDANGNFRQFEQLSTDTSDLSPTKTITTGANDKTLIISIVGITTGAKVYAYDIQVEEGQTKTDFRPYIEYQRHNVKIYTYEGGEDLNFTGMDANGNLEGSQAYNGTTVKYAVGKANIAFDGTTETISYTNCNGFNASYYNVTDADISRSYENSTSEANRIVNTSLVIPNTHQGLPVTDILPNAFYGGNYGGSGQNLYTYQGYYLLSIELGNNTKVLHNNCFGGCRAEIDFKNVEYIAHHSLGYIGQSGKVYTVIDEVEFPTSVRYIEYSPFTKTTQLTIRSNITQPATTIDSGTSISGGIYDGVGTVIFTVEVTEVSGKLFDLVTSVLKFLHTNNDSIDLSGITSQKTAMATTIYTDNNYIHSFDWASKNITPTFYHLDGTAWE